MEVMPERRVLVVDDEAGMREMVAIALKRAGFSVSQAGGALAAMGLLSQQDAAFPVVISDLAMPDGDGLQVLEAAKHRSSATEVIIMTAHSTVENAVDAMKAGARGFVTKPFSPTELTARVEKAFEHFELLQENERLKNQIGQKSVPKLVAKSPKMRQLFELVERIAATKTTVLITGASGTGKEQFARRIHALSDRAKEPFLVVNCGALPENVMESELFGHEKGAFTGANQKHLGIFREAEGGTVFLDEVGELPLNLQVKLLRVLQEKSVRAVGASAEAPVNVRVLAATNQNLEQALASGAFREDLYYRLNVIRLELPTLKERPEDIIPLAERFLHRMKEEHGREIQGFAPTVIRLLENYEFPGNVRELENIVERAVALCLGKLIQPADLPEFIRGRAQTYTMDQLELPPSGFDLNQALATIESRFIEQAYERAEGNRRKAAELLGLTSAALRYRAQKLELFEDESGVEELPSDRPSSESVS